MRVVKRYIAKRSKKMLFKWVEWDFNSYIDSLERYKLKEKIHNKLSFVEQQDKEQKVVSFVEYIASFVVSMYSEYDKIPPTATTIEDEARYVTDAFIKAYNEAYANKKYDLLTYFAVPEFDLNTAFQEDGDMQNEIQERLDTYVSGEKKTIKELVDLVFESMEKVGIGKRRKFLQPGIKQYALVLWCIIYQCVIDIKQYSQEYGITYVKGGEGRCLFNYFNLYIHEMLFTGKIQFSDKIRRVIFAASALHPAEDDYIDRQDVTKESIEIIQRKLLGEQVVSDDENLKPILDLIDVIYQMYPPKEHPNLVTIFTELHDWQIRSLKQKETTTTDELLEISFMKGGYAFAFYGYVAFGNLSIMQFRHFFGMGAIFQIMDDLHDIEEDLAGNIETIWTKEILKGEKLDDVMSGIIGVQVCFEQMTSLIKEMKRPISFRRMELGAVRLDLAKFYMINRKYFSNDLIEKIKMGFGIDIERYVANYELKLDQLDTMDECLAILLEIKDAYMKKQ